MWIIAIGIVFASSVMANGALQSFGHVAGTATALYFCIESLVVGIVGTTLVVLLPGDTAWPLAAYCTLMAVVVLGFVRRVEKSPSRPPEPPVAPLPLVPVVPDDAPSPVTDDTASDAWCRSRRI